MAEHLRSFVAICFFVIGVSHIVQHRAWSEFFALLRRQGRPGAFANGFLSLSTGALIVSFHNVWEGIPLVLTLIGWGMVLKALVVFAFPSWGLRSMAQVPPEKSWKFVIGGFMMLAISGLLISTLIGNQI